MLRHIQKYTIAEAQRIKGDIKWSVILNELEIFIGLVIARGVISGRNLPIKSFEDGSQSYPLFNATMPHWRFLEIMRFLWFDQKSQRERNLETDTFVWPLQSGIHSLITGKGIQSKHKYYC